MTGNISKKRKAYIVTMKIFMGISVFITCALVLFLIGYVLIKGIPNISWELVSTKPSYLSGKIGILARIFNALKDSEISVKTIYQSVSECNIIIGIETKNKVPTPLLK